jgi:membrane fusion protein (multidrug efflux system)
MQTGTFLLRASVNNPDGILRPNQFVRVRVKGAVILKSVLVPQRTVQQGSKGHFVWVVGKEGKAEQRPVVVGDWHGEDWFIFEGLKAGDQVVVDGGLTLRPGMPVTVKPAGSGAEPVSGVILPNTK